MSQEKTKSRINLQLYRDAFPGKKISILHSDMMVDNPPLSFTDSTKSVIANNNMYQPSEERVYECNVANRVLKGITFKGI